MNQPTAIDPSGQPCRIPRRTLLPPTAPTRLVVADDDDEMRRTLASALRREGYLVSEARDGLELIDKVMTSVLSRRADSAFRAVVSDIRMPRRSGIDVLVALRNLAPALPIILITAFGDPKTHEEARWLGADAVIDKPFDMVELRDALQPFARPV